MVGVCTCSMFCCMSLYVHSSIAIILMGKRELIALLNLSSWCLVMVERLFLAVPMGCLQFVIVVFPDHTHLLFLGCRSTTLDNDIRKSGHYSEVNKPNRCYSPIFVGAVIAVGRVSSLMSGVLQVLFPGGAHSFTSCQLSLLVKDEH